ncbi:hypothetical protein REC12_05130 [Desulfosporosinus sp. PR]|uniref:hypothetical protein n=1 Tax=Candidatus Desulfosporosinus nitrosoreducens TaxID=3401928 RepID=UPI0027EAD3BA|nr:hypothetical protein [Desulfosporosinus sp. PR]MDQ7092964.1 hypothetical protein [Desulfosporosinus sp. PR]
MKTMVFSRPLLVRQTKQLIGDESLLGGVGAGKLFCGKFAFKRIKMSIVLFGRNVKCFVNISL